jgi:Fe-coproporphyrin III synthase
MGNLHQAENFLEIWNSEQASAVREKVANCPKSCWMIGSASPVIKKYIRNVIPWVVKNKIASLQGKNVDVTNIPFYHVGNNDKQGLH